VIPDQGNPQSWDRYAYVNNAPLNFVDPTGNRPCDEERLCNGPVDEFQLTLGRSYEGDWDTEKQEAAQEILNKIAGVGEFAASVLWEPADWALTARDCISGDCSPLVLLGLLPLIPGSVGKYGDDILQLVPSSDLHWSQEGISWATKNGIPLDDLAQDMAQGWKRDPLRVLEVDGKLVSLDNRRLAAAKLLGIDVPVSISFGHTIDEIGTLFKRDGIFTQTLIRGTNMVIDMLGRLK
jgi:hypothetical protein